MKTKEITDKHEELYGDYRIGYCIIIVQSVGQYLNVFTHEYTKASDALDCYEDFIEHFRKLAEKHEGTEAMTKVIIKQVLLFGKENKNPSVLLCEITPEKLTSLANA